MILCKDERKCFAKGDGGGCRILQASYKNGECPFCKPDRDKTGDKVFPLDYTYGKDNGTKWIMMNV